MTRRRKYDRQSGSNDGRGVNRRRFLAGIGAGATATSLAGCLGGGGGGGGGGGNGSGGGSGDSVKIGAVFLLSGLAEALGQASRAGAELGVQHVNENGGINGQDVEIVFRDHDSNGAAGPITSLVQEENVDVLIGLTSSGATLQAAPTMEQLGVPMTLTDIGTPWITEFDEEKYGDEKAAGIPNLFRTNANTTINTYAMAKYAVEELDVTRVANIGPDYAYGTQTWDYFKAFADALGGEFEYVESVFPTLGASDMTPQINQVLAANPDLVFTSFWAGDAVTFVQQATEQGLFDQVDDVFDTLGADPTVFEALGTTMPEGVHYSSWYWHSAYDNQENQDFVQAYKDANGGSLPSFTGPTTFSAIQIYKKAIEAAGSTEPDAIISEMEGMSHTGPRGEWTLDADSHQASAPTIIGETSKDDDVPYEGVGLKPVQSVSLDKQEAYDLLKGTDLPPGM
ncbi:ABC transporter substrate-binding protein [Halomarina litorea]|uniref:ABC transporter substrate-binding protein n=1 Tax=Halomarina litorea TaxID=2961595 RepID=UPI0020C23D89|nr:ABC transporter substrate-binding protein [Halomarina sp. BCD28]